MHNNIPKTKYTELYYEYNKEIKKLDTLTDLPNDVLVSFTINDKKIITNLQSLFNTINMIKSSRNGLFNYDVLYDTLFKNINLIQDIESSNMKYLKTIIQNNEKVVLIFLYKYRFSKQSLHGINDIYIENFINNKILNLGSSLLNNKVIYLCIDKIYFYKISVKTLYNILLSKRDNKKIYYDIFDNDYFFNKQRFNMVDLCNSIINNSIYSLFISIK